MNYFILDVLTVLMLAAHSLVKSSFTLLLFGGPRNPAQPVRRGLPLMQHDRDHQGGRGGAAASMVPYAGWVNVRPQARVTTNSP